jgi:hypothetical protein
MKRKDSKDMQALREIKVSLKQESRLAFAEKLTKD